MGSYSEREHPEMDEDLRESKSQAKLQAILNTVPTGVVLAEAGTEGIAYFSPGARKILGGPVTGTAAGPRPPSYELLKPDGSPFPPDELPLVRSLRRGDEVSNVEILVRRRDGSTVTILANSSPVLDRDGKITGAVASLSDVTELAQLRQTLQQQFILLQRALVPSKPSISPGYEVAATYLPAAAGQEIGGDFYDIFETRGGDIGILIGDVAGKGVKSAALAAATRSTVRAFAHRRRSAARAIRHSNSVLFLQQPEMGSFVTLFLAVLTPATGRICYCSAGHPPPAVRRSNGRVDFLTVGQPPIGLVEEADYRDSTVRLDTGDKIIAYTDGISEAHHDCHMFDLEGVERTLVEHGHLPPDQIIEELLSAAKSWGGGRLSDDVAILVIERVG